MVVRRQERPYAPPVFWKNVRERITDALLARRVDRWVTGAIAVLLIALGFIAGRWMSLNQETTPIIFQEAPGDVSSSVSPEELTNLTKNTETPVGGAPRGTSAPRPAPVGESTALGAFVASANGQKYYFPDCPETRRVNDENKIWFDTAEEAEESGYQPSACVQKRL